MLGKSRTSGIVLALGGGGAAGLAHIGVLQVLGENDIRVRAVAGTSIGAEIGAFFASGMAMRDLEAVATSFDWKKTLQLFFPDLPTGGLISGIRIVDFLNSWIGSQLIEDLEIGYAAVAADLDRGGQVILDRGDLVDAVRSSISIPGMMAPYNNSGRWLVDGGVVNPVPFDVARKLFGGPVVAVSIHSATLPVPAPTLDIPTPSPKWRKHVRQLLKQPWMVHAPLLRKWLLTQVNQVSPEAPPSVTDTDSHWTASRVLNRALDIAANEIVQLRAAASAPDLVLKPEVYNIGVLEFYEAREAIAAGRRVTEEYLPYLYRLLGR